MTVSGDQLPASSAVEPAVSSPSLRSHNKKGKQRNQLVQTVGTMIDQADKKCGLLFKQSEASERASSTLKEDIKYLSLLNASRSLTNKWTPRSHRDVSWISFALKMLALLHPIISDCHCIVFDRRILSAFCSQ